MLISVFLCNYNHKNGDKTPKLNNNKLWHIKTLGQYFGFLRIFFKFENYSTGKMPYPQLFQLVTYRKQFIRFIILFS
jgi:hypothetical protein